MRKIYQTAPDVPQVMANKAVEIIERHFAVSGVRRAEDLPEESKVHLLRELQGFFTVELPMSARDKSGNLVYTGSRQGQGFLSSFMGWLERIFRGGNGEVQT